MPSRDFQEAVQETGRVKATFPLNTDDSYDRGARLIRESVECGVTFMRAHVEVDSIVGLSCLSVALALKKAFAVRCDLQIAGLYLFLQERLFMSPEDQNPGPNLAYIQDAICTEGVSVVGSAPYVEATIEQAKMNLNIIYDLACSHNLQLDFHLDYNLDSTSEPLIYEVIRRMRSPRSSGLLPGLEGVSYDTPPHTAIGHATRLQLFLDQEWHALFEQMKGLPIHLVGLPV
ncbi:hypothetical protein AX16_003036 [Volvariella volvacea WC 439]|nr:hypothetical protein AX16_003036 [Volvariella volvacea WC 439]